jgi:hypothetical protein
MTDNAPERIWVWVYREGARMHHRWRGKIGAGGEGQTEYVRADLCDPLQDERVKALVEAARKVNESYWYASDGTIRGMYDLEAALAALRDMGVE